MGRLVFSAEELDRAAAMYAGGYNPNQIASTIGRSYYQVRSMLKLKGYKPGRGAPRIAYPAVDDPEEAQPADWLWCMWPGCRQDRRHGHGLCYAHHKIATGLIVS
jgi:hypothetical protein